MTCRVCLPTTTSIAGVLSELDPRLAAILPSKHKKPLVIQGKSAGNGVAMASVQTPASSCHLLCKGRPTEAVGPGPAPTEHVQFNANEIELHPEGAGNEHPVTAYLE